MMYRTKHKDPRTLYREEQGERVKASPSLAEKYRQLKGMSMSLDFFVPEGTIPHRHLNYDVNLQNAHTVFRMNCPNDECVHGDFDLSEAVARAVAKRKTTVEGELQCEGWQRKPRVNADHCHSKLRYRMNLKY